MCSRVSRVFTSLRKYLFINTLLLCLGFVQACSHEELCDNPKPVDSQNSRQSISFVDNIPKSTVSDLGTMEGDASGFRVYATSGSTPSGWYKDVNNRYIDGSNNHIYNSTATRWGFVPDIYWPTLSSEYPVTFYALYPALPTGLGAVSSSFSPSVSLSAPYTVQGVSSQLDLLAAKATANTQPTDGIYPILFDHILSMVDFGIVSGIGTTPHIQSIEVVNVMNTRTYDFVNCAWQTTPAASGVSSYSYFSATGANIWPAGAPVVTDESTNNPIYTGTPALSKHLMLMPQSSPAWRSSVTTGGMVTLLYRMGTGNGTTGIGTTKEVGLPDATQHPNYSTLGAGYTGALYVKAGFPFSSATPNFTWEKGIAYNYKIGLGTPGSCNGYILDEYYYTDQGVRTNLRLIEIIKDGKQLYHKLQDGEIHVMLDVYKWEDYPLVPDPPASVQIQPKSVILPYPAQSPAAQMLTVVCKDGQGNFDNTMPWTITVVNSLSPTWLRLALNPDGTNPGGAPATTTLSGVGNKNVYLVADINIGASTRTVTLSLNGSLLTPTVDAVVTQEVMPGASFTGWLYVKEGSTGTGINWSNAMGTITEAITLAQTMQSAPYSYIVKGILVAGGTNAYPESFTVPANVRVFGGWAGTPGTELTSGDTQTAPYTSAHRNLSQYKAIVTRNITVSGGNATLDGFIIKYVTGQDINAVTVTNGAVINAVEITNNTMSMDLAGSYKASLVLNNGKASNILVANNTGMGVEMLNGSVLVNGTIANNAAPSTVNNATLLNSVVWGDFTYFGGSNTVQYCAFPDGSPGLALSTNNIALNTNNMAWFTATNVVPGPHFYTTTGTAKPYYSALSNRCPMLGRGNETLFDNNTTFMPAGSKKDINGNPRHTLGTDIGCYEDGVFEGFKLEWATDRLYVASNNGYLSELPLLLPGNTTLGVGVQWSVSQVGMLNYCQIVGTQPIIGSGTGVMVGTVQFITVNDYHTNIERKCGDILIHTNLGGYLPDATVEVWQVPGLSAPWKAGYVGSFHRNNEVGSRYISGQNSGPWTVRIVSGLDWIKIDNNAKNYGADILSEPNPYGLGGYKKEVEEVVGGVINGDGDIRFRVGMKSANPNPLQPRYGLIIITRSGGVARFYVRQGEAADYLYRPTDPREVGNGPDLGRASTVKFSPYTLSDATRNTAIAGYNVGNQGGSFEDYPSKIGYFYQWNRTTAYSLTIYPSASGHRDIPNVGESAWSNSREVCPPGYRQAGMTEWVQSLYWKVDAVPGSTVDPSSSETMLNYADGHYADGYYDIMAADPPVYSSSWMYTGAENSIVGSPGVNMAMRGVLMINHYNYAAIFFPTISALNSNTSSSTVSGGEVDQVGFVKIPMTDLRVAGYPNTVHWCGVGQDHIGINCNYVRVQHASPVRCVVGSW